MIINKEENFLSAVIYVHNSELTISNFIKNINEVLKQNFEKYEIICVNDASEDDSVNKIKNTFENLGDSVLSIVNMSFYQGLEASMNAGVDLAIGDFILEFDNDYMDYSTQTIMDVYFHSLKGFDIVAASNSRKLFTSSVFYKLYNRSSSTQYKITTDTFRILSRRAINRIHAMSRTIPYRKALYSNCGLKVDIINYQPEVINKITHTKKQIKSRQDTAFNTFILFTNIAYKISLSLTTLMMMATLGGLIYTIIIYALGQPVAGYTTMMLVITGSFFGVFAILAIIIKYLSILVDLIFVKQKYTIESIEKISK